MITILIRNVLYQCVLNHLGFYDNFLRLIDSDETGFMSSKYSKFPNNKLIKNVRYIMYCIVS